MRFICVSLYVLAFERVIYECVHVSLFVCSSVILENLIKTRPKEPIHSTLISNTFT